MPDENQSGIDAYNRLLGDRNPYGSVGEVRTGISEEEWEELPDWLQSQYRRIDSEDGNTYYEIQGYMRDEDGNVALQIGDLSRAVGGDQSDSSVIDWSRVRWSDTLGLVTDPDNIRSVASDQHRIGRGVTLAAIAAMAAGAGAQALGGAGGAGAESATFFNGAEGLGSGGETLFAGAGETAGSAGAAGAVTEGAGPVGSLATQPPVPVTTATPAVPGTGIFNTVRNAAGVVSNWWEGLSPASRFILGQGISGAAQAGLNTYAQREQQEFVEEIEEERRQDRRRRGSIPAFGRAYTRRPGIIGSRRGG